MTAKAQCPYLQPYVVCEDPVRDDYGVAHFGWGTVEASA